MVAKQTTVLIMAAGTGGHVFPALAIAREMVNLGARIEWLGTPQGLENDLLVNTEYRLHRISVRGLRGTGLKRKLMAPVMLVMAIWQALRVIRAVKPHCVLGMGGFVSGPGGVAAKLLGKPLLIHEQNAVAGATNKILSRFADGVFEAFPGTFPSTAQPIYTGNPLRTEIAELHGTERSVPESRRLRVLVLGGSLGATAINNVIPAMLSLWPEASRPELMHQTGARSVEATRAGYRDAGLQINAACRVEPFINDMATAYAWADVVVCRSGASTVSELAAVGLPAILIPYPHHADQQQLHNANWLINGGAATLLPQSALSATALLDALQALDNNRSRLHRMGKAARQLAVCDADVVIARRCIEVAHA